MGVLVHERGLFVLLSAELRAATFLLIELSIQPEWSHNAIAGLANNFPCPLVYPVCWLGIRSGWIAA